MVLPALKAITTGCPVVHASPVSTVNVCVPVAIVNVFAVVVEY
jgi:hypothetical protein